MRAANSNKFLIALVVLGFLPARFGAPVEDILARLQSAAALEKSKDYQQSAEVYRDILRQHPECFQAHAGLGRAYFQSGQYPEAAESFERALRLRPGNREILESLAKAYLRGREPQRVLDLFSRKGYTADHFAWAHLLLARAYDAQDKVSEARREIQRALALDPHCPGAHFALGFIAWTARDAESAEKEFRWELGLSPPHPLAFYYLAEVLEARGEYSEAETVLQRMGRESPKSYFYHFGMGKLRERKANFQSAAEEFRKATSLDPSQPEAHYRLAVALRKLGETARAKEEFELSKRLQIDARPRAGQGMGQMRPRVPELD